VLVLEKLVLVKDEFVGGCGEWVSLFRWLP